MMRSRMLWAALWLVCPSLAAARADIVAELQGPGFEDATRVRPIGGNGGTTLGEQRKLALTHALDAWASRLDSVVPIRVEVEFDALGCQGTAAVLGSARPQSAFADFDSAGTSAAVPGMFYPSALADSLAGRDLGEGEPDILVTLNSSVDDECQALTGGFYYGFDAQPGDAQDLVYIVLHEVAHGLGLVSLWDPESGEFPMQRVDAYSAQIRDIAADKTWPELTAAERLQSAVRVRGIAWDGALATALVEGRFRTGAPSLTFEPSVAGYSGFVSDTSFGDDQAEPDLAGQLYVATSCRLAPLSAAERIVLFPTMSQDCQGMDLVDAALSAGAAGALLVAPTGFDVPALPLDASDPTLSLPLALLSVSESDAAHIRRAAERAPLSARVGRDDSRLLGADGAHRPLLFVSSPYSPGSSIGHLEPLTRPNELMEPFATETVHDLGFTTAMLRDLGWPASCGNGALDPGEACDSEIVNGDTPASACRADCTIPRCGDGVRDDGEECDEGIANDDRASGACRTTCRKPRCGDGVVDADEGCDRAKQNSDSKPNACRTSCEPPYCGDGVVDALEQCDDGDKNSDSQPGACRADCRTPSCGDGAVDSGEECDEGRANGKPRTACRADCTRARCMDAGEACDGAESCSERCRPRLDGPVQVAAAPGARPTASASAPRATPDEPPAAAVAPEAEGCGCNIAGRSAPIDASGFFFMGCALVHRLRRRARRVRRA